MYYEVFQLHAKLLKALSHPKRLEIIHLLREHELSVTSIYEMLDLPQANLSQHLHNLREAGVVKTQRSGKQIYYSIAHKNFVEASDLLREILIERNRNEVSSVIFARMTDLVPLTSDPVCGMRLSPKTASFDCVFDKKSYYFCASGCLEAFNKNSNKYIRNIH